MNQVKPVEMRDQWLVQAFNMADSTPIDATEFVDGVMKRIRRRAIVRFSVLGTSGFIAFLLAVYFARELSAKWGGYVLEILENLNETLGQLAAIGAAFPDLGSSSLTLVVAFASMIAAIPLLHWLTD